MIRRDDMGVSMRDHGCITFWCASHNRLEYGSMPRMAKSVKGFPLRRATYQNYRFGQLS